MIWNGLSVSQKGDPGLARSPLSITLTQLIRPGTLLAFLFFATGCKKEIPSQMTETPSGESAQVSLAKKGRTVYQSYCIACHNADPKRPGSIGPEIFGSSKELLEARLLRAEYPPGYTPKRPTQAMPKMPQLASEIEALHAYLNSLN